MNEDCELKILDFGLARPTENEMTGYVEIMSHVCHVCHVESMSHVCHLRHVMCILYHV